MPPQSQEGNNIMTYTYMDKGGDTWIILRKYYLCLSLPAWYYSGWPNKVEPNVAVKQENKKWNNDRCKRWHPYLSWFLSDHFLAVLHQELDSLVHSPAHVDDCLQPCSHIHWIWAVAAIAQKCISCDLRYLKMQLAKTFQPKEVVCASFYSLCSAAMAFT